MSQLGRIIRNLIRAEEYEREYKEWADNLFHPLSHLEAGYEKSLYTLNPYRRQEHTACLLRGGWGACVHGELILKGSKTASRWSSEAKTPGSRPPSSNAPTPDGVAERSPWAMADPRSADPKPESFVRRTNDR